jgi:NAD(P)-dependent dehydrogenase (short-subunit alcohol dehydrogenase family)
MEMRPASTDAQERVVIGGSRGVGRQIVEGASEHAQCHVFAVLLVRARSPREACSSAAFQLWASHVSLISQPM